MIISKKSDAVSKIVGIISVILLIIILRVFYYAVTSNSREKYITTLSDEIPTISGEFIRNPDIINSSYGHNLIIPKKLIPYTSLNGSIDWEGNGFAAFSDMPLGDRYGIAIIHPQSLFKGGYLEQSISLPEGKYIIIVGMTDIAGLLIPFDEGGFGGYCADVGIKIILKDNVQRKKYIVFDEIIKNDRWYDYSIDIGDEFNGRNITLRVESYAADSECGIMNGEWAAIDYIDIVKKNV